MTKAARRRCVWPPPMPGRWKSCRSRCCARTRCNSAFRLIASPCRKSGGFTPRRPCLSDQWRNNGDPRGIFENQGRRQARGWESRSWRTTPSPRPAPCVLLPPARRRAVPGWRSASCGAPASSIRTANPADRAPAPGGAVHLPRRGPLPRRAAPDRSRALRRPVGACCGDTASKSCPGSHVGRSARPGGGRALARRPSALFPRWVLRPGNGRRHHPVPAPTVPVPRLAGVPCRATASNIWSGNHACDLPGPAPVRR